MSGQAGSGLPGSGLNVLQPGLLSLIQDAGRFGCHGIGLTTGGPLDPEAFRWANRLCGNDLNAAALEVSFGGLVLEAQVDTRLVVAGAEMGLKINGEPRESWCCHGVRRGDRVELGYASAGCRAYLAVAGGFTPTPRFGSVATVTREGIGGLNGERLQQGDLLPCAPAPEKGGYRLAEASRPVYGTAVSLRVILGYQQAAFDHCEQARFFHSEYRVTERSDRMGFRLEGPAIRSSLDGILSEGICPGAIQVPADGQPIVLMNDRQTIGGYPKLGSVISLDTARLAQLTPGARVSFEVVSQEQAHNLHWLARSRFERVALRPV